MKFGAVRFPHEMLEATKALVVAALTEVSRLPEAVEPDWLKRLEEEEESSKACTFKPAAQRRLVR